MSVYSERNTAVVDLVVEAGLGYTQPVNVSTFASGMVLIPETIDGVKILMGVSHSPSEEGFERSYNSAGELLTVPSTSGPRWIALPPEVFYGSGYMRFYTVDSGDNVVNQSDEVTLKVGLKT